MPTIVSTKKTWIDPKQLPKVEGATLRRILAHLRPYRAQGGLAALAILLGALFNLVPPLLIKHAIDEAIPRSDARLLFLCCSGMVLAALVAGVFAVWQKYLTAQVGERVMRDLRVELFEHLQRQPHSFFVHARPGETLSSVLNDVQGVGSVTSTTLAGVVESLIVAATTSALVFALDWRLALVALVSLPAFVVPGRRVGQRRKELRRAAQVRMAELTGILDEALSASGSLLTKVFGAERIEGGRLRRKADELLELSLRQTLVGRWFQMFTGIFEYVSIALVFAAGGWLVIHERIPLGTVVAFVTLMRRLYPPASALAGVQVDVLTSYAYFERVFRVLDMRPAIVDSPAARRLERVEGALRFEGVSVSLSDGVEALNGVDLEIAPGQSVALVGPSGAGKSTLAFLVPRLYDPSAGRVLLDGSDLRELEMASLRSHIGMVTQETYLFYGSVMENLLYARPDASRAEVEAAARAAQVHDLIASLPAGYETMVGRQGYRMSGGERQRLAVARALLRDPRILILDEATSSVDAASEALIQAALGPLLRGRTSLIVAHRLSTVRRADLIVVLDRGRIVERGSHATLLARGGLYARLYEGQPWGDEVSRLANANGAGSGRPAPAR
jgi:ATP-binding cassette, subfamily B, bacterial